MPAIGARTTGVSTTTFPRRSSTGRVVTGPLSAADGRGTNPEGWLGAAAALVALVAAALVALVAAALVALVAALLAVGLPASLRGPGPGQLTGPGDRVELLVGPEADRCQLALVGGEVDHAGLDPVAVLELLGERRAVAGLEGAVEDRELD